MAAACRVMACHTCGLAHGNGSETNRTRLRLQAASSLRAGVLQIQDIFGAGTVPRVDERFFQDELGTSPNPHGAVAGSVRNRLQTRRGLGLTPLTAGARVSHTKIVTTLSEAASAHVGSATGLG